MKLLDTIRKDAVCSMKDNTSKLLGLEDGTHRAPAGALPRLDERAAHSPQFRYCGARGDKRPAIKAGSALSGGRIPRSARSGMRRRWGARSQAH